MAGASLAAELAPFAAVILLEAEDQPGYHATGRSAAFWEECYGGPRITPLTQASGAFLRANDMLRRRGAVYMGRDQDRDALDRFLHNYRDSGIALSRLDRTALATKVPGLRDEWTSAIWQPDCADIDVARLHAHYLAQAKAHGARLLTAARLVRAQFDGSRWTLDYGRGCALTAKYLVNAAGAWADPVAQMAGVQPLGIVPHLRTIAQLQTAPSPHGDMPLALDISGRFYFKPENGRIWLSPNDEVPGTACDAAPDDIAVAEAIDRLEQVVDWQVQRVEAKWAGLRSFAPDRLPVYGADTANPAFIWFAGQGGFGIQTAPAAAALLARQLVDGAGTVDVTSIDPRIYAPARFD